MKVFTLLSVATLLLLGGSKALIPPINELQVAPAPEIKSPAAKTADTETLALECRANGQEVDCNFKREASVMTGVCGSAVKEVEEFEPKKVEIALTCANLAPAFSSGLVKNLARSMGVRSLACQCTDSAGGSATIRSSASSIGMSVGLFSLAPLGAILMFI